MRAAVRALAAWFAGRSIRLRLTLAFAGAAAVLLGGLALALYVSFESGLDGGIERSLQARATELTALAHEPGTHLTTLRRLVRADPRPPRPRHRHDAGAPARSAAQHAPARGGAEGAGQPQRGSPAGPPAARCRR